MFATHKQNLLALSVFLALSTAVAKPISSEGLVLNLSEMGKSLNVKDSSPAKNSGRAASIVVPNSPSLVSMQHTHQISVAVWIKPNSLPHEFPTILSKGLHNTPGKNGGYELYLNSNGDNDVVFFIGNSYVYTAAANGSLINHHLGEWIHVAVTVDVSEQIARIYVNGRLCPNVATYGTFADANFDMPNDLYIGRADPAAAPVLSAFDGDIERVMIYNRLLSADEVKNIFSSTKPK